VIADRTARRAVEAVLRKHP